MNARTSESSNSVNTFTATYSNLPPEALVSRKIVEELTGFSPSTLRLMLKDGRFPQPKINGRKRRWRYGEVINWLRSLDFNREGSSDA